jgi:hypothetical protein
MLRAIWSRLMNLPSIAWVILFPLGIIAFIGSIILFIVGISSIEGFATVIFLVIGWFMAMGIVAAGQEFKGPGSGLMMGGIICFYALMGMALDQPGNFLFNKPIGWFCPSGSSMNRDVSVLHPLPGRTDLIQRFMCVDIKTGKNVEEVGMFKLIGVRFVEYVVVAYGFMALHTLLRKLRPRRVIAAEEV